MFWFFGPEVCGILAPWPGIEPAAPALKGKVLNTGPPEKSLQILFKSYTCKQAPTSYLLLHNESVFCEHH